MAEGVLLPAFHRRYWLGLYIPMRNPNLWPRFLWLDGNPAPNNPEENSVAYAHWGTMYLAAGARRDEPNNLRKPEFCVVANYTQDFEGERRAVGAG